MYSLSALTVLLRADWVIADYDTAWVSTQQARRPERNRIMYATHNKTPTST
jgi:hypothetical protein